MQTPQTDASAVDLYLDLMKKALIGILHESNDRVMGGSAAGGSLRQRLGNRAADIAAHFDIELVHKLPYDAEIRERGLDHPPQAESMIGSFRMDNIRLCVESVIKEDVPGDLIETGVWRGGATIFMRAVLKAYGIVDRTVWVADSFEGLPKPNPRQYPADEGDLHHTQAGLRVGVDEVKHNFYRYGLLDDQVRFLVGWFEDTLRSAPIRQLAVLRLDGDMYSSTMQSLEALYPLLSRGGFCIIDDYMLEGAKKAVHDYRKRNTITDNIVDIDGMSVYWRKTA